MKKNKKILIIKHGSLGDLILSTGAMKSIAKYFKDSQIYILTSSKYCDFIIKSPYIENYISDDRLSFFNLIKNISTLKKIIKMEFDYIFDLQNSKRTMIYNLIFRLFTKSTISSSRPFSHYRYFIPPQGREHIIQGLNNQLSLTGIKIFYDPDIDWLIKNDKNNKYENSVDEPYVIVIPGTSLSGKYKRWSLKNYAEITNFLIDKKIKVLLVGTKDDEDCILPIIKYCPNALNYIKKSDPKNLYRIAKNAKFTISNDTGPAHLVSLTNKPLVWIVIDNKISISNKPFGKNVLKIASHKINEISVKQVINLLKSKKLI